MIGSFTVRNWKSIRHITMDCRRVNVLIGEPDTGKSNILEALGLLSWAGNWNPDRPEWLTEYVRFEHMLQLFRNMSVREPIEIAADEIAASITTNRTRFDASIGQGRFMFSQDGGAECIQQAADLEYIKFYVFGVLFGKGYKRNLLIGTSLETPYGFNMGRLYFDNEEMRRNLDSKMLFHYNGAFGDFCDNIEVPSCCLGEGTQRLLLHIAAMDTNKNCVIVFQEPESRISANEKLWLGERIGFDTGNQYFVSTHDKYILAGIRNKTPLDDLAIFIVHRRSRDEHQRSNNTKIRRLSVDELSGLNEVETFLNLDHFFGKVD